MSNEKTNQTDRSVTAAQLRACRDVYRFSDFCLDRGAAMLTHLGERIPLAPKATQLLLMLLDNAPRLVSRDELRAELWSESTFIEFEGALNACVRQARAALGDSAGDSDYIETVPKRGYRFVAELEHDLLAPVRRGIKAPVLVAMVAAVAILIALFFPHTSNTSSPELLVVLPVEGDAAYSLDPITGYGIAMIASEHIAGLKPDQLAVVNSRSLRELVVNGWDIGRLKSPDYVVRTRILERGDTFVLDASLRRHANGEVLSTHIETLGADMATILRGSPDIIVSWLSEALDLEDDSRPMASVHDRGPVWDSDLVAAFWHLEADTLAGTKLALEKFNQALTSQPKHVWALEGKLTALADLTLWQRDTLAADRAFTNMEETARFMLDNDIHSGKSYQAIGFVRLFRDWDLSAATNHIEAALLIAPDDARTHSLYATALAASGDTGAAVRSAELAERLDPATMAVRSDRCWFLVLNRDFRQAAEVCESALQLDSGHTATWVGLSQARIGLGDEAAALQIMIEIIRRFDDGAFENFTAVPTTWQELGCLRADEILSRGGRSRVFHYQIAKYHTQCGRRTEALKQLKLSLERKERPALFLRSAPEFDSLRDDPEFKKLQKMLP